MYWIHTSLCLMLHWIHNQETGRTVVQTQNVVLGKKGFFNFVSLCDIHFWFFSLIYVHLETSINIHSAESFIQSHLYCQCGGIILEKDTIFLYICVKVFRYVLNWFTGKFFPLWPHKSFSLKSVLFMPRTTCACTRPGGPEENPAKTTN